MKLMDFDGLFDEKLTQYMEENKNKYSEKQWENVIPKLYKKFGDTHIAKLGCTPKEYYQRMTDAELTETLSAHLLEDVPVPEFLCAEIESRGETERLLPLLESDNEVLATYAVNLIGDQKAAYDAYFSILAENRFNEDLRNDIIEVFKFHADDVKDGVFALMEKLGVQEYMLEILSRVTEKDERIYDLLVKAFRLEENLSMRASYLAAYGDERALPMLLERIEDKTLGFVDFQELKYAIEALGGEYDEERDFSEDKDYLAVEVASKKGATTDGNDEIQS
ncbi:MAG: hypothetical protein J6D30_00315 [Clostridia bacterium]|nr:hypothetical protein [Clostridia bacterium]